MIDPLPIREGLVIPSEFMSVSYTRNLVRTNDDGEREAVDGAEAARRMPSAVELRLDVKACSTLDEVQKAKVLAFRPLLADRRGVVRITCADYDSRPKNLGGARLAMSYAIRDALLVPDEAPSEERKKRGRGGLFRAGADGEMKPVGTPKPARKKRAKASDEGEAS